MHMYSFRILHMHIILYIITALLFVTVTIKEYSGIELYINHALRRLGLAEHGGTCSTSELNLHGDYIKLR